MTMIYCIIIFIDSKRRDLLVNAELDGIQGNMAGSEPDQHDR